jgi:hypothetical protein
VALYVLFIAKEQHFALGNLQAGSHPDIAFIMSADVPVAKSWPGWFAPSFTTSPIVTLLK